MRSYRLGLPQFVGARTPAPPHSLLVVGLECELWAELVALVVGRFVEVEEDAGARVVAGVCVVAATCVVAAAGATDADGLR
jgi:hypothetical protein